MKDKEEIIRLDSEAGIIATLIQHPEYYFYSEHLKPNHFTSMTNQYIYTALSWIAQKNIEHVDSYNILEILNSSPCTRKFAENLAVDQINEMIEMSGIIARASIEEYKVLVNNVMDAAFRNDTVRRLDECKRMCMNQSEENIAQKIYGEIDSVMSEYSTIEDIPEISDVADMLWDEIVAHQDGKDAGVPFKFPTLNEYVTLEAGELVVVAAPQKGAKSMLMMNEAVDILKRGKSVMYIDSELSSRLFLCRLLSHLTGIEFKRIRTGRYDKEEENKIKEQLAWVKSQRLTHIYMPLFDQQTIYTAVKKVDHRYNKLDVLIVDYLKSGDSIDAYATYAELGNLTNMIKNDLCGAMGITGLAAAQLTASNKLADSAKISRNASTIIIMTDKLPNEIETDGEECGNKKLTVLYNRNGMQHAQGEYIDINFSGNTCTLTEAKQHIPTEDPF